MSDPITIGSVARKVYEGHPTAPSIEDVVDVTTAAAQRVYDGQLPSIKDCVDGGFDVLKRGWDVVSRIRLSSDPVRRMVAEDL